MDLKKVALSVMLISSLAGVHAGCGDDGGTTAGGGAGGGTGGGSGTGGGTGGTGTWVDPAADCAPGTMGAGTLLTYEATEVVLPYADDAVIPGFDFDGVDNACGVTDFPGSVDNGLAGLTPFLDAALALVMADNEFINDEIAAAITAGTLNVTFTIEGWNGTDQNDTCVIIGLDTGVGTPVTAKPAAISNGQLYADVGTFDLELPIGSTPAGFTLNSGLAVMDITTLSGEVGGIANRGAATYGYTETIGMTAPAGTLYATIYDIIVATGLGATGHSQVDSFLPVASFDINAVPSGDCAATSLGFFMTVAPVP